MRLMWWRIIAVAIAAELLYGAFLYQVLGDAQQAFAPIGMFSVGVFMLIGGAVIAWIARSRELLQGTLVGVVAIVFYTLLTIPVMLSGELQITGLLILNHVVKLIGAALGALLGSVLPRSAQRARI